MKRSLRAAVFTLFVFGPSTAMASEAGRLFDDGVKLLDQGKYAEACPKLEASQRLEPAAGTLLNLAGCYERSGKRALALTTFREAADASRARGRADWQKVAEDHVRSLGATVPTLTILLTDLREPPEVELDGIALKDAQIGVAIPVDTGAHVVLARSTGKRPFSSSVTVARSLSVTIPALEPLQAPSAPSAVRPPADHAEPGTLTTQQLLGIVVGSVGVGSLVLGGVSAIVASRALEEAKSSCPAYPTQCTADASAPNDRAQTFSTVGTLSFVAGGALLGAGALLFFVPLGSSRSAKSVAFDGSRVWLRGRF